MRKDQVKLSQVQNIPSVVFSGTFGNHMKLGDKKGNSHSGLHIISEFKKQNGQALTSAEIQVNQNYPSGTLNSRSTTVKITAVDGRAKTFKASVNIYGTEKVSTFFPVGTTLDKAKEYIEAAWKDHCTYGTSNYGGGDVDIDQQIRAAFGLQWVGMAAINGQQIWVGSNLAGPGVDTAFAAVDNKFT